MVSWRFAFAGDGVEVGGDCGSDGVAGFFCDVVAWAFFGEQADAAFLGVMGGRGVEEEGCVHDGVAKIESFAAK